jgi:predicted site-specific integrase-resolvase
MDARSESLAFLAELIAEILGLTIETVRRYQRAGKIPSNRLRTGVIRYDREEVLAWARRERGPRGNKIAGGFD